MTTFMLTCQASQRIITGEEDRLRALRHTCSALPRMAQALPEQVRQLSYALLEWDAAPPCQVACVLKSCASEYQYL